MSLRGGPPVTNESQPKMNDQDVRGSKDGHYNEESINQRINEWSPDDLMSFATCPAGSSYPGGSSDDQTNPITTTLPTYQDNSVVDSSNSRFALIILNQPIEMEIGEFLEMWTRGIALS